MYSLPLFK